MPKQVFLEQFERRLTELDYPSRLLRRKAEELSDHYDFLLRVALKEGLSEPEAEARSAGELGNPVALAEQAVVERRQSSWWGRHPIIGYILLPAACVWPMLVLTLYTGLAVILTRMSLQQFNGLFNNGVKEQKGLLEGLFSIHYVYLTLLTIPFCWMARRSAMGLKWATVPCVICAVQGMSFYLNITNRNLTIGYHWEPKLLGAVGPLLVAAAGFWRRHNLLKRLPPLPEHLRRQNPDLGAWLKTPLGSRTNGAKTKSGATRAFDFGAWFKKSIRMPTYWIIVIILLCLIPFVRTNKKRSGGRQTATAAKSTELEKTTWPAEREATAEELRGRQATRETTHETTVDLRPYINTELSESTDGGKKGLKENSLGELPLGTHVYGGVPFNVQGRIQLMGHGLEQWQQVFPVAKRDIKVGRKCGKIFLFHGENCNMVAQVRGTVARLVLHYTDGSEKTIEIKSGEHVLDWWGVTYTTQANPARRFVTSPGSELAWIGKNPWIQKFQPTMSLRLFKSTFENPQPDVEIDTVDYVSAMTYAAPFMVGLTVE